MNGLKLSLRQGIEGHASAFTLIEVVVSVLVTGVIFAGVLTAYIQAARFAEWSGYSLAAQALSIQQLEQARSAKWDTQSTPEVDEITSIPTLTWTNLDVPMSGGIAIFATNYISISNVTIVNDPLVRVKFLRVDTAWPFRGKMFTNTVATYLAPDR